MIWYCLWELRFWRREKNINRFRLYLHILLIRTWIIVFEKFFKYILIRRTARRDPVGIIISEFRMCASRRFQCEIDSTGFPYARHNIYDDERRVKNEITLYHIKTRAFHQQPVRRRFFNDDAYRQLNDNISSLDAMWNRRRPFLYMILSCKAVGSVY